jgi:MYXO-CTERM domain-containing protein
MSFRMRQSRTAVVSMVALLAATRAAAHGSFPATSSVHVAPGQPETLLVGTTFGTLMTRDGGATWRWICEEAQGYSRSLAAVYLWSRPGTIFVAGFQGLAVSRDGGCSWEQQADFAEKNPSDVREDPARDGVVYLTTSRFGIVNGLHRSRDDGRTFTPLLTRENRYFSAVRIAQSDPRRVYVSAYWNDPYQAWLLRSDDGGESWTEVARELPELSAFYLLGVSPTDKDVVFAKESTRPNRLLRSTDAGATFSLVAGVEETLRGFDASADGQTVWIAGLDHIFRSTDGGATFTRLETPQKNACVRRDGARLFACGWQFDDGWALGVSEDTGDTWRGLYVLQDVGGVLECAAGTATREVCDPYWPQLARRFGIEVEEPAPDGGADGGASDGSGPAPAPGCGCAGGTDPAAALVALTLLWRRRR